MAIRPFLAMTAAEMREVSAFPHKAAWMACHFSPYGRGLSNLPRTLPENSLLIVDDITPIHGHDPEIITHQLIECHNTLNTQGILLDFQRAGNPETAELVQYLSRTIPCPLAISEGYADSADLPVFVSPVPPSTVLREHLVKWTNREIWLDIAPTCETLTVTEKGCQFSLAPSQVMPPVSFPEEFLHCHYTVSLDQNSAVFTLCRTESDLHSLLKQAEQLGIRKAVGLYQELGSMPL